MIILAQYDTVITRGLYGMTAVLKPMSCRCPRLYNVHDAGVGLLRAALSSGIEPLSIVVSAL
jgi:hypothetical protein